MFHCVWVESENAYLYCSIDAHSDYVYGAKIDSDGWLVPQYLYNFDFALSFSFALTFQTTPSFYKGEYL